MATSLTRSHGCMQWLRHQLGRPVSARFEGYRAVSRGCESCVQRPFSTEVASAFIPSLIDLTRTPPSADDALNRYTNRAHRVSRPTSAWVHAWTSSDQVRNRSRGRPQYFKVHRGQQLPSLSLRTGRKGWARMSARGRVCGGFWLGTGSLAAPDIFEPRRAYTDTLATGHGRIAKCNGYPIAERDKRVSRAPNTREGTSNPLAASVLPRAYGRYPVGGVFSPGRFMPRTR